MATSGPGAVTGPGDDVRGFVEGLRWRVLLSVLGPIAWLVFTLLYLGFWASGFTLFQDLVVFLVSVLILCAVLATSWILWGGRRMRRWRWG